MGPEPPTLERTMASRMASMWWLAIGVVHAIAAAAWWWLMPAGFAVQHPRFFINRVVPWLILVVLALTVLRGPRARRVRPALLAAIPVTWISAAVSSRIVFPNTLHRLWVLPLVGGLVMLGIWWLQNRAHWRSTLKTTVVPGLLLGAFLVVSQRAADPATHPIRVAFPAPMHATHDPALLGAVSVGARADVVPGRRAIVVGSGRLTLDIEPMLHFISRSPDGCWTLFARTADRIGPQVKAVAIETADHHVHAEYLADDEPSMLDVRADDTRTVQIEAMSELPRTVWSHLNTFTALTIVGHRRLFVVFSPAPDVRIEVEPMDYPFGRPARFAYLDATGTFHVAVARDAEKGPFTDLASGPLAPGEPLTLTLFDDQTPKFRITLEDFSAQASTQVSPTAGWGVPENALEFSLSGNAQDSMAVVFITLAGTSVGRGFDSVGHAAGVYRNRIRIEPLP